eukprot:CAMPEP_0175206714 /NCGR_PEP_ID=MMETSP0093-20121207/12738_1 /TAXON_ID=311494 /ORGANISM="Alexandrium monilatum, Strain CCMP3105" /LENGTH=124 /DNA_ID=CAMNT_0016499853 /DNA_START=107 /DNA_END=477 /DNA_ORIENTATION=+
MANCPVIKPAHWCTRGRENPRPPRRERDPIRRHQEANLQTEIVAVAQILRVSSWQKHLDSQPGHLGVSAVLGGRDDDLVATLLHAHLGVEEHLREAPLQDEVHGGGSGKLLSQIRSGAGFQGSR